MESKSVEEVQESFLEFETIEDAVRELKLDRRRKYFVWCGELIYAHKYTAPCSGCSCDCSDGHGCNHKNSGCEECGYTGKRKSSVPIPVYKTTVRITPEYLTYINSKK
jgi:hypothetical protein